MVSCDDIKFWTGFVVSEEDAVRYTSVAKRHLEADGGNNLAEEIKTEAMCYFIASRIDNSTPGGEKASESIGGYSYSKKSSISTSRWLDLYNEIVKTACDVAFNSSAMRGTKRVDRHVMRLNRRIYR